MALITAVIVDGVVYGSWLFIVAIGLTLIYGVMNILNVAHGSLYGLGAFTAAWLVGVYFNAGYPPAGSFALLLVASILVGLIFGLVIERGLLRFMYDRDEIVIVLVTFAVFLILEDFMKLVWGAESYMPFQPKNYLGWTMIAGLPFSVYDLGLVGVALIIGGAVWYGVNRTRPGKLLHAVIFDREIARAMGINVTRIFTTTFVIGAILGAIGGALTAPTTSVTTGIGVEVIVLAFAVVVIGGLGSIEGAALGALVVGLARTAAVHFFPVFELFTVFAIMSLVLILRPEGLFGRTVVRKI